jgi:hypothetical protein
VYLRVTERYILAREIQGKGLMTQDWAVRASALESAAGTEREAAYRRANADIIRRTVEGVGIDSDRQREAADHCPHDRARRHQA